MEPLPHDYLNPGPIHPLGHQRPQWVSPAYSTTQARLFTALYGHFERLRLAMGLQMALLLELSAWRTLYELTDNELAGVVFEVSRFENARQVCAWLWERDPGAGRAPAFRLTPPPPEPATGFEEI